MIELLLADPADSVDERIKVAQYLLLDSQEALRARLAELGAAYDQAHDAAGEPNVASDAAGRPDRP